MRAFTACCAPAGYWRPRSPWPGPCSPSSFPSCGRAMPRPASSAPPRRCAPSSRQRAFARGPGTTSPPRRRAPRTPPPSRRTARSASSWASAWSRSSAPGTGTAMRGACYRCRLSLTGRDVVPWSSDMKCPRCAAENREGARFCRECGALFAAVCSSCGAKVEGGSKFCDSCGTPLAATPAPTAEPLHDVTGTARPSKSPAEAELRQLTVMFCDLVGSTELAARLDPEALRDVVRSYQQVCDAVIRRLHGNVAQYLGDGLLVYFGYPVANE